MWDFLRPDEAARSIYQIDVKQLWNMGYRAILTDLDNTLTEWNSPAAGPKLVAWLQELREQGFRVCILSNNGRARVEAFAAPLGIPAVWKAGKPGRRAFREALRLLGAEAGQAVMVGDQMFTDVWGGNRMGMYTVLVDPVGGAEAGRTRFLRGLERVFLLRRGGQKKKGDGGG